MKCVTFPAKGEVRCAEVDEPESASGREAILRVEASGLCHTDIDVMCGRYGAPSYPIIPGHEYAGVVVEVGPGVSDIAIGDRVVVDPNICCGICRACTSGKTNLCQTLGAYGVTRNGGFSELSKVDAGSLVKLEGMSASRGALAEPVACVLNGLDQVGRDSIGESVIFGAGPIGLIIAIILRSRGVAVTVVDREDTRLLVADRFSFATVHAESAELAQFRRQSDLAVDATGQVAVAESLCDYVCDGGTALLFGVCDPEQPMQVSAYEVFRRQLRIVGSHSLNRNIPDALDVLASVGAELEELISHRVPLEMIPAFMDGSNLEPRMKVHWSA